jgi:hypothetical protein
MLLIHLLTKNELKGQIIKILWSAEILDKVPVFQHFFYELEALIIM